jgi:hypothetical protein
MALESNLTTESVGTWPFFPIVERRALWEVEMGKYLVSIYVQADGMTKDEVQTTIESMLYEGREFSNNPLVMDVDYGVVKVLEY